MNPSHAVPGKCPVDRHGSFDGHPLGVLTRLAGNVVYAAVNCCDGQNAAWLRRRGRINGTISAPNLPLAGLIYAGLDVVFLSFRGPGAGDCVAMGSSG